MTGGRLPAGGRWIDRSRPVRFTFDGRQCEGFAGDTLASALLANGVDVVCPSPILGRPRGVFSAGVEEPCAFVEVSAPWFDPIVAATMVNLVDGLEAAGRAGVGRLRLDPPPAPRAEHRHLHVETLVVGGGVAGIRAALAAGYEGDRVLLVDERPRLGGTLAVGGGHIDGADPDRWLDRVTEELGEGPEFTVLTDATALGVYDDGYVVVHERRLPALERIWHVHAGRVVIAAGAHERPIAFADNDRPGVMLAGAVRSFVELFATLPGELAVVFTTNRGAYDAAVVLREAGTEIATIVDVAEGGPAADDARSHGFEVLCGWAVAGTDGDPRVNKVHLAGPDGERRTVDADLLCVSGGWNPAVQLYRAIGGGMRYDRELATFVPDGTGPDWLEVIGAAAGDGLPASVPLGHTPAEDLSQHFVDLQRDQTVADVLAAVEGGLRSVEHVKRATYIGTAIDQGRTSGVLTAEIVNAALGWELGAQGATNARPPYVPVSFAALAGPDRGMMLDPVRTTPMHAWHVEHGAVFENVGQWKRPWYFPRGSEDIDAAVARECLAVREGAGVLDASTLGKIEVVGPDAATFLDRMYTNRMSSLVVGSIRYGLMLGLDGMVFDDGVAMRLAEDRFLVTTTTGGAAGVLDRFEEWLQTEWPDLRVYCTSVTEQWAVVGVGGPRARHVVMAAGCDIELSAEAFPWMTWREGTVAGVPCRVCRVSFTGELSYELHVPSWHGAHMWDAVMATGEPLGVTPYGTEAMHVLRAEKGYVIVGQDTDGTVTPDDLGMSWIVNPSKGDFVGKRSLVREDTVREGRKQLVGLMPAGVVLGEGAQLVARERDITDPPPVPMLGHVTSSYPSAAMGRPFALAMVSGGRARIGETVFAQAGDGVVACAVVTPVFWDPKDERRDG